MPVVEVALANPPMCMELSSSSTSPVYREVLQGASNWQPGLPIVLIEKVRTVDDSDSGFFSSRGMPGTAVSAAKAWTKDEAKLAHFTEMLTRSGVRVERWSESKSVESLFWETSELRGSILAVMDNTLKRITRIVRIKIVADICGVAHVLLSRLECLRDRLLHERQDVPVKKLTWRSDVQSLLHTLEHDDLITEDCELTEHWRVGCSLALKDRLGLSEEWQSKHLREDPAMYSYAVEHNESNSYPTLMTTYCIHEVGFRVTLQNSDLHCIGLPEGGEFATAEGDFLNCERSSFLPMGSRMYLWTWMSVSEKLSRQLVRMPDKTACTPKPVRRSSEAASQDIAHGPRKAEIPNHLERLLYPLRQSMRDDSNLGSNFGLAPNPFLVKAVADFLVTLETVERVAASIAGPEYSLSQFNADLQVFPELSLYLLDEWDEDGGEAMLSSGRTQDDEYQRTIGAFFGIYWLMRLRHDGKEGFSYGVDNNWQPKPYDECAPDHEKRLEFYKTCEWAFLEKLLVDAELLVRHRPAMRKPKWGFCNKSPVVELPSETWEVNVTRVSSLLALTAMHDIMKIKTLLPTVQHVHGSYHGYRAGDVIWDHDHALSYLMDHYAHLLASFCVLDEEEKRAIQFTQCELGFNHGWFVQAEAPPGATLRTLREALVSRSNGTMKPRDIAFYFVHWITDLAGAEPTPLAGCEKFVVKFPVLVFNRFLHSFDFVQKIAINTETEVMEEYLKVRWTETMGELPVGDTGIAKMRILCMAQSNAQAILEVFDNLPGEDKELLSVEMARTGCVDQRYSSEFAPQEARMDLKGPALLVYYGPAFLQALGKDPPLKRLRVLAEVYRCGRTLYPATREQQERHVSIRVDTIKSMSLVSMVEATKLGKVWVVAKHNENEAFVELSTLLEANSSIVARRSVQFLDVNSIINQV